MSAAKKDRSATPRISSRPSRAKERNHTMTPPCVSRPAGKPKPGERAMGAQLASRDAACHCGHDYEEHEGDECSACGCLAWSPRDVVGSGVTGGGSKRSPVSPARDPVAGTTADGGPPHQPLDDGQPHEPLSDDPPPPADPWWTPERERAFVMTLQGMPQHQVAAELNRDRHTVARWTEDERFATRLYDENAARFRASRQRRSMQTLRLTDKAERLAGKMLDKAIDLAERGEDQLGVRLAARDWLQEFRENSRREDEIFGLDKQRVDVNVRGEVQHRHKGKVDVSFKTFLSTSLNKIGVDPDVEEVDAERADQALVAVTERALGEGTFLDDLVEREKQDRLAEVGLAGR